MLVLSAPGLDPIDLDDHTAEGYICEEWTLGPPEIRDVVSNRTLANGVVDRTAYVGSRAVTLTIVAFPHEGRSVQAQIDRLQAFCRPDLRPTLSWRVDTDPDRSVVMRAAPGIDFSWQHWDYRRLGLAFVTVDPFVYDATETQRVLVPVGAEQGRRYDEVTTPTNARQYDRTYPVSPPSNVIAANPGTVPTHWRAVVYGPCTNPRIYNDTTGQGLELTNNGGVTLAVGESAVFDTLTRTITVGGVNRRDRLSFASQWWLLVPGENVIRFAPVTSAVPSQMELVWRGAHL